MKPMIRTVDKKGRVALPGLAGATVIIEQVDETEYRIRKATVIPEKDLQFPEETLPVELSAQDALRFLEMLDNPPRPSKAARKAAKEFVKDHGHLGNRQAQ